jgi:hypothetical protein
MSKRTGIIIYKIDDELITQTRRQAVKASGKEKLTLYKKLRFFMANKGKFLAKPNAS